MLLHLFGNQVIAGNREFFGSGIRMKINDLHTVQQGTLDRFQTVCRCNEHTIGKVDRQFHEIIAERLILLSVQNLQHGRCGISAHIMCHLIDFVKKNQRIVCLRLDQRIDDSTGHGSYISFSVSADLRFIVNTAERYAYEFAVGCSCNGGRDGRFTRSGRTDKTNNLSAEIGIQFQCRQVFNDSFLDLRQALVIVVQNFLNLGNIQSFFRFQKIRDFQANLDIIAEHRIFGRTERNLGKALDLLCQSSLDVLGIIALFQAIGIFTEILIIELIRFTELLVNDLQLFAQIIISLIFLHALVNFFFDVCSFLQNRTFRFQKAQKLCRTRTGGKFFKDRLFIPRLGDQIACSKVTGGSQVADRIKQHPKLFGKGRTELHEIVDHTLDFTKQCSAAKLRFLFLLIFFINFCVCKFIVRKSRDNCSGKRFHDDAENAALRFHRLLDLCSNTNGVNIRNIFDFLQGVFLANDKDGIIFLDRVFKNTLCGPLIHINRHGNAGECDKIAHNRARHCHLFYRFGRNHKLFVFSFRRFIGTNRFL